MTKNIKLMAYLQCKTEELNAEFPKYREVTNEVFSQINCLLNIDFGGMPDNRVYRYYLDSFKDIIIFLFSKDVTKVYLRSFFKSLNTPIVIQQLTKFSKNNSIRIQNLMNYFVDSCVSTWQWCNDNKNTILENIIKNIDSRY